MLVTESGMVTDCKDQQSENALSPMLVTESGMVTDCKEPQVENALLVKSEQSHPLGDGKKPFTGGQK